MTYRAAWFLVFIALLGGPAMAESTSIEARHYTFKPREDITAFELATALPVLISGSITAYDALPENVKRHFELESDRP